MAVLAVRDLSRDCGCRGGAQVVGTEHSSGVNYMYPVL